MDVKNYHPISILTPSPWVLFWYIMSMKVSYIVPFQYRNKLNLLAKLLCHDLPGENRSGWQVIMAQIHSNWSSNEIIQYSNEVTDHIYYKITKYPIICAFKKKKRNNYRKLLPDYKKSVNENNPELKWKLHGKFKYKNRKQKRANMSFPILLLRCFVNSLN